MASGTLNPENARILIVDDEPLLQQLLSDFLSESDYSTQMVGSVDGAKRLLENNHFDLILTDLSMPGGSGVDLIRFIKEQYPEIGCVVITSDNNIETARRIIELGIFGYILKPFDRNSLLITVQNALHNLLLKREMQSKKNELEQAVWERNKRLSTIMDHLHVGVILFSPDMAIVEVNRKVHEWFPDIILNQKQYCYHLIPESYQESICDDCPIFDSLKQGKTIEVVKKIKTWPGKRYFRIVASPIYDKENNLLGGVGLYEDITDKNILEQELRQAQKIEAIGQLAAGITHEINTPVQYVGHNLKFLKDSFKDLSEILESCKSLCTSSNQNNEIISSEVTRPLVEAMENADIDYLLDEIPKTVDQGIEGIQRVAKIVRAMKEFSHPDSKEKIEVNINELIESTLTLTRNQWKYVAKLETDFHDDLPLVSCLPGELNQVFLNLIVNAAHSIEGKTKNGSDLGTIKITTRDHGDTVQIMISDTGCGIPNSIRDKVFDPFFTTKERGKGTGQGLAIARRVITEKHQGTLAFETEPGEGTTFIIDLPLK